MSADGPNTRYLRVDLGSVFTAAALVRSWREGRVEPNETLEIDGKRLTFRQACSEDSYLRQEIGPLPTAGGAAKRSWFEERRFRREAWRRVVEMGDFGPAMLAERIDSLSGEVEQLKKQCAEDNERLEAADRREKDLVAALRTGAEDVGELEAICKACEDARTDGLGVDALGRSQAGVLGRLGERLRTSFSSLADGSTRIVRVPDAKRIEQIVLFHKRAHEEADKAHRKLSDEKLAWTQDLERRKNAVKKEANRAKDAIGKERKAVENQLIAGVRNYQQAAALHGKWREEVSRVFLQEPSSGSRHQVGDVKARRPEWLIQALFSYAPMVAPESVLGIFKSGGPFAAARYGFLVAWDGLHWSMSEEEPVGFVPWGWHGRIKVERGMFGLGADVELDGRSLSVWRAGSNNELESFLKRVDDANRALPTPTFKNGGAESFRRVSALALEMIDSITSST